MRAIKSTFKKHMKAIKKKDRTAGTAGSITPSSNPDLNVATTDVPAMGIEGSTTHIHNNPETSLNPGLNVSTPDIPAIEVVGPSTVVSNDQQRTETPQAPNVGTATADIPTLGVVGASTIAGGDEDNEDTPEILKIRKRCPRFRILIIGKANSGKTTILQKMCGTTDTPIVIDKDGKKINPSVLEDPTAMRGMHDIENEIFYPSNHGFVFHDSRGFEAGSVDEMDKVRNFIAQRSAQSDLKDRLHVIWFCVPMDSRRILSTAELAFFENGTGDVPVIVLFTKWDGQIVKSYSDLKQEGRDVLEAKREAPEHAMGQFKEHYLPVIIKAAHPPAAYVLLGNMHKQEASCSELTERTASAMSNGILSKLFVSVQNTNIQISMQRAIEECIEKCKFVEFTLPSGNFDVISRSCFPDIPAKWPSSIDNSRRHAGLMVSSTALWFYHIYVRLKFSS
ncbi:hypothetical protein FRC03_001725 [Tulasnella sp. 419]|nr:hypothetical protein FRC03_001725 [Tulasnella sp. 419]